MGKFRQLGWRSVCLYSAVVALVANGCATAPSLQDPDSGRRHADSQVRKRAPADSPSLLAPANAQPETKTPSQVTGPLTLQQLMDLAIERHPDLAIAQAKADAARGQLVQAGLYPNPSFSWLSEEMGLSSRTGGFQGPNISQDIVTANKLELAQAAASRDVSATEWLLVARRYDLLTRVRLAYFDVLTAQRSVVENQKIIRIAEESLKVAKAFFDAGTGNLADVLRAEIELSQSKIRLEVAQQSLSTSWKLLATAVGTQELPAQSLQGNLEQSAPRYDYRSSSMQMLERSAELRAAQAKVEQAQALLERAQAEVISNISVKVHPFYSFNDERMALSLEAGVNLPIFNRNQGNIMAAKADLARAGEEARQMELQLMERLTNAFQRYRNAQQQHERYRTEIIPKAQQALEAVQKGYAAGDAKFDYTTVLQAQQILIQAQLANVQFLSDLWKAASEIAGLLQLDDW
jgi:cobalt-zinc-cadmium efflux system outer membrane protein